MTSKENFKIGQVIRLIPNDELRKGYAQYDTWADNALFLILAFNELTNSVKVKGKNAPDGVWTWDVEKWFEIVPEEDQDNARLIVELQCEET